MAAAGERSGGVESRLPNYELICTLASGGMAEVHLAKTATRPPTLVVIKSLPPALVNDAERRDMLADEARVGRLLRHPNLVRVLDGGLLEGAPYLVLEYVDGPSLKELMAVDRQQGDAMDLDLALTLAIGVCDGLHYAHLAVDGAGQPLGLVHRDISPPNIMVGQDGVVRLLDFGVARAEGRRHETVGRCVKGKIAYTAPEYILGQVPDRRADVFALAIVLWEVATGRRLFQCDNMAETVRAVMKGPIPLPSLFNHRVPPALDEAVRIGLARDLEERWPTAAALRDALYRAAFDLGGVLAPAQVARRLSSGYPAVTGDARALRPEMSRDELSSKAIRVRESIEGSAEWLRDRAPDTALEVDIDPLAFAEPESDPHFEISEDVLAEDD